MLTYAGDTQNLQEVSQSDRYKFITGDIRNHDLLQFLFKEYDIQGVIHFAAESHVDNSITGPEAFITTNVNGTFHLIEAARQHWMKSPFPVK